MLKQILQTNNLPDCHCAEAEERSRESLFFLAEEFVRKYYRIARLPEDHLEQTVAAAGRFNGSADQRALCMYLHICFCEDQEQVLPQFPEFIDPFGYDCGYMYLLILLSLIPKIEERAVRENFPMKYALDAAARIGTYPVFYAQKYAGHFGIRAKNMPFMRHYVFSMMFRIGRLDFALQPGDALPHIYEDPAGKKYLFCAEGWELDQNGDRIYPYGSQGIRKYIAHFSDDGDTVRGILIDPVEGLAQKEASLSRKNLHKIAGPGDWTLRYHIPGGGGMKKELCRQSFQEAWTFFARQYPDIHPRIIFTTSWINDPAWTRYIPHSNMADMIRSAALFPNPAPSNAGFYFVFGRDDADYASYPRTNSLERAILDHMRDHGKIRAPGILIYADAWQYGPIQ